MAIQKCFSSMNTNDSSSLPNRYPFIMLAIQTKLSQKANKKHSVISSLIGPHSFKDKATTDVVRAILLNLNSLRGVNINHKLLLSSVADVNQLHTIKGRVLGPSLNYSQDRIKNIFRLRKTKESSKRAKRR
ncbi:hypothetical protein BD560DRAFT_401744, partial [Blakeslea trispora]